MQNIFKQQISNQLYTDIFTTYQNINYHSFYENENKNNINKKEKHQKIAMIASGSLGLLSVGMMAMSHFDVYQFSQESIQSSALAAMAFVSINATLANTLNRLRSHLNQPFFDSSSLYLNYPQFEKKLINDLKSYGVQVEYKEIIKPQEHTDLKEIWKNSNNPDFVEDLKSKTTDYVKRLMDTYVEPSLVTSSKELDQEYVKRMLDGTGESREVDISSAPNRKLKKNTP